MHRTTNSGEGAGLVVVSNRGPISFECDERGGLVAGSPSGGLAATLGGGVRDGKTLWIAAAMTEGDRVAADTGADLNAEGYRLRLVSIDPDVFDAAYNVVANQTLWFWHHHMFDLTRQPVVGADTRDAWEAFRAYNEAMADATAESAAPRATVLVHDYHLALLPGLLRKRRPDLRISHFTHTPWVEASLLHVLPEDMVDELLAGMAGADATGFHSPRWAEAFAACCTARDVRPPTTFVAPAAADHPSVADAKNDPQYAEHVAEFGAVVGHRLCIARVDRMEPSKNIVRGFLAFDALLEAHPELCGEVTFVAIAYPSRSDLEEYRGYADDVETTVADVNARRGTHDWTPIVLITEEGMPRAVAALARADVVFVNPIRDGLNLVAYEALVANERDAALVLSHEAGAWDDLGAAGALGVNPFDVCEQADTLYRALTLPAIERGSRAARLRRAATARTPQTWLAAQVEAAKKTQLDLLDLRAASNEPVAAIAGKVS